MGKVGDVVLVSPFGHSTRPLPIPPTCLLLLQHLYCKYLQIYSLNLSFTGLSEAVSASMPVAIPGVMVMLLLLVQW